MPGFVHLHVHTHYSLLDGACRISDLVNKAKELGMDSLAITDHGCMFGVVEFFNECKKVGIKPILGMEAYMAPGARQDRNSAGGMSEAAYHLLLLCQNLEGYRNLVKLSSTAYRDGFYYRPRIDKDILRELKGGLIATSSCLKGEVANALVKQDAKRAKAIAETYLDIFGPDKFFIEVQKQGVEEQEMVNPELVDLAKRLGCGLVATNDVHFLNKEDHFAHDVLCCISMGRQITDEARLKYSQHLYLKSPAEMKEALGNMPEAIANTARIAAMCDLELDFSKRHAPVYPVPADKVDKDGGAADSQYLRRLCDEGLVWRYGKAKVSAAIKTRLEHELKIIESKKFSSYFLIVWDFCNYARQNNIPVGARGSGVGTMVGYLLGLCDVDPIRYGLLFERFMDPNRNEMPDIDIDICQEGRARIIDYVRGKYGHVAQIITFGTLAARAACKDVGRVLGVPLAEIDKLTKLIPGTPGMTLDKAIKSIPEVRALYEGNPTIQRVIDIAKRLEGLCRNAGTHAAGVVIADRPLDELVPLYRNGQDILTQFEGPIVEKCGLLKMDFLGLRTLTTLARAVELVKQSKGVAIDLEKIDLTDKATLGLFCRGETRGVFQFESGGMQDLLMKMQPDRLEDLIAANALYRPGPMELIPSYCDRKHKREALPQVHPIMDRILEETYGIMVYQEQVMQIFNQLGGIALSDAYKLIKAISKKTVDVIAKYRPAFMRGAMDQGVSREKAEEIFELILRFGGYGFNKSHSTRYAIIAFETAYLKTHYPVEFMAALLTYEAASTEKMVEYIEECRRMGLKVLPPDVNESQKDFTPVPGTAKGKEAGVIRFGLNAVRGVGEKAVEQIIAQRQARGEFTGLFDFASRVDTRTVPRATVEALIKCGAFSSMKAKRSQLLAALESATETAQREQEDRRMGQMSMFAAAGQESAAMMPHSLPDLPELASAELLKMEKELLGFYITSHPLMEHQAALERYTTATTRECKTISEGAEVVVGGMISRVKRAVTKTGRSAGQPMAMITLEDLEGQIDGVLFSDTLAQANQKTPGAVANESIVFLRGKVDRRRETPSIVVQDVIPIETALAKLTRNLLLVLDRTRHTPQDVTRLRDALAQYKGSIPVYVRAAFNGSGTVVVKLHNDLCVKASLELDKVLHELLGTDAVRWGGDGSRRRAQQQALFAAAEKEDAPAEPALAAVEMVAE